MSAAYLLLIRNDTTLKTEILKVAVEFSTLTLTIILNINCRGISATFSWLMLAQHCTVMGTMVKYLLMLTLALFI